MIDNFKFNSEEIDKIKKISKEEKDFRIKNLNLFNKIGFPNKKKEDWKFSDFKEIIYKNFKELNVKDTSAKDQKINLLKDFDHNYLIVINGEYSSCNFQFEEKTKLKSTLFTMTIFWMKIR